MGHRVHVAYDPLADELALRVADHRVVLDREVLEDRAQSLGKA